MDAEPLGPMPEPAPAAPEMPRPAAPRRKPRREAAGASGDGASRDVAAPDVAAAAAVASAGAVVALAGVPAAGAPTAVAGAPAPPVRHALPDDLLGRAPDEAVRLIALALLEQARAARERLPDPSDTEALHDFRVALRRLRSTERAHRALLADSVRKKARKRLRAIARATGASRDLEVLLQWLDGQRGSLNSRHRAGAAWLRARWLRARRKADARLARDAGPAFDRLRASLARTLPVYWRRMRVDAPPERARFAPVLAARLREASAALETALGLVTGPEAVHEAHEARIAAKRVRYLLEPVKAHVDGGGPALKRLRELQDMLGELHDLDVLQAVLATARTEAAAEHATRVAAAAEAARAAAAAPETAAARVTFPDGAPVADDVATAGGDAPAPAPRADERRAVVDRRGDPEPGIAALERRARTRRDALFAQITARWLDGGARGLLGTLAQVAASLDAAPDPHALPLEVERKYLLRSLPHVLRDAPYTEIEQGWLPGERLLERLRRTRQDGVERCFRTVKLGRGVARIEVEEPTSPELFAVLWPATAAKRIRKHRFAVREGERTWEVDRFLGRELVLAEVELPSPDTPVTLPAWLAPYVVREVTDEGTYVNANLALPDADASGGAPGPAGGRG